MYVFVCGGFVCGYIYVCIYICVLKSFYKQTIDKHFPIDIHKFFS